MSEITTPLSQDYLASPTSNLATERLSLVESENRPLGNIPIGFMLDKPIDEISIFNMEGDTAENFNVIARINSDNDDELVIISRQRESGETVFGLAVLAPVDGESKYRTPKLIEYIDSLKAGEKNGKVTTIEYKFEDLSLRFKMCPQKAVGEISAWKTKPTGLVGKDIELAVRTDKSESAPKIIKAAELEALNKPFRSKARKLLGVVGLSAALITQPNGIGDVVTDSLIDPTDKVENILNNDGLYWDKETFISRPILVDETSADGEIISGKIKFLPSMGRVYEEDYVEITVHGINPDTGEYEPWDYEDPSTRQYLDLLPDLRAAESERIEMIEEQANVSATIERLNSVVEAIDSGDDSKVQSMAQDYENLLVENGGMSRQQVSEFLKRIDEADSQEELLILLSSISDKYGIEFNFINEINDDKTAGGLNGKIGNSKSYIKSVVGFMTLFKPEDFKYLLFDINKFNFADAVNPDSEFKFGMTSAFAGSDGEIFFDVTSPTLIGDIVEYPGSKGTANDTVAHEMMHRFIGPTGINESVGTEDMPLQIVSSLLGVPLSPSTYGTFGGSEENRAETGRIMLTEGVPDPNNLSYLSAAATQVLEQLAYIEGRAPGFTAYLHEVTSKNNDHSPIKTTETGILDYDNLQYFLMLGLIAEVSSYRRRSVDRNYIHIKK